MSQIKTKYLISVIPLVRVPLTRDQDFFYTSADKIPFGTLVEIPFGPRKLRGIVIASKSDFERVGGMKIKRITKVLDEKLVSREQLKLVQFISHYYLCPLGIAMKHITPPRVKMRALQQDFPTAISTPSIRITAKEKKVLTIVSHATEMMKIVLQDTDPRRRQYFFLRMITEIFSEGAPSQILYLVPELTAIPAVEDLCRAQFGAENVITLHSKLSKGAFYDAWDRIRNNSGPQIIVATRTGLFAPYQQLRAILLSDTDDITYKQWDMNPRYDARRCSEELGKIHKCPVLFASAAPRITDRFDTEEKRSFFALPSQTASHVTLINMCKEHWKNNPRSKKGSYAPISSSLRTILQETLKKKEIALLFINHQGLNSFSICTQCKNVLRCPTCTRALVESQDGTFRCLHCAYQSDSFPMCPSCKNMTFRAVGVGTERIEKDITKFFPSARVLRVDGQSMKTTKAARAIYDRINSGEIDVVIGTQMITKSIFQRDLGCIAVIDADAFFGTTDFSVDEKAYAHLAHMISLGRAHKSHVVIQTFSPEHRIVQWAINDQYDIFYREECEDRRILHLPPFTTVVTMTYRSSNKRHARIMAEKMRKELLSISTEPSVRVQPVHKPLLDKVRGDYRRSVSFYVTPKKIPKKIEAILAKCESAWIIDRDPIATI